MKNNKKKISNAYQNTKDITNKSVNFGTSNFFAKLSNELCCANCEDFKSNITCLHCKSCENPTHLACIDPKMPDNVFDYILATQSSGIGNSITILCKKCNAINRKLYKFNDRLTKLESLNIDNHLANLEKKITDLYNAKSFPLLSASNTHSLSPKFPLLVQPAIFSQVNNITLQTTNPPVFTTEIVAKVLRQLEKEKDRENQKKKIS